MIYLDNASTTWPKLEEIKQSVDNFFSECFGSYHRTTFGRHDVVDVIRSKALDYFDATNCTLVFTPSATIAMNMVINSLNIKSKEIITTNCERVL